MKLNLLSNQYDCMNKEALLAKSSKKMSYQQSNIQTEGQTYVLPVHKTSLSTMELPRK
jgi:hypothetical protein